MTNELAVAMYHDRFQEALNKSIQEQRTLIIIDTLLSSSGVVVTEELKTRLEHFAPRLETVLSRQTDVDYDN